jgi:hypothetical protein
MKIQAKNCSEFVGVFPDKFFLRGHTAFQKTLCCQDIADQYGLGVRARVSGERKSFLVE